jgi:predicted HTH domain antitoxin
MKIIIDQTLKSVLERMKNEGLDEESAMDRIIDLGIKDYTVELYRHGDLTLREASDLLHLSLRQTLDIIEKKIGGNVGRDEACRALELAKRLAG